MAREGECVAARCKAARPVSFICSNGHALDVPPGAKPPRRCLGYQHGLPCKGKLTRVGEGAVKAAACDGSGAHVGPDPKSKKGKGRCPECGKLVTLTKAGALHVHQSGAEPAPEPVEEPDEEVTITLPGAAVTIVAEGNWPNDNPRGWKAVAAAHRRKVGFGTQWTFSILREDADDLANYLSSVADVVGSMTAEERQGSKEHIVATKAWGTIQEALG